MGSSAYVTVLVTIEEIIYLKGGHGMSWTGKRI